MEINYPAIGKRIAKRRNVLDLTQEQTAEKASMSPTYLSNVERASSIPSIETIMKLCRALEVTPDYFLLGVDKEYRNDDLSEIKDEIYRCEPKKIGAIKSLIQWFVDLKI